MLNFSIPPKPGEVTLDQNKLIELLYLPRHTHTRESLLAGAGFAIGSMLANECETHEDATEIVGEIVEQAQSAFETHNRVNDPNWVSSRDFSRVFEHGIEQGRILTIDLSSID